MAQTLYDETLTLLTAHTQREKLTVIARKAGVGYHWLHKLWKRRGTRPNVHDMEKLHTFLKENNAPR